SDLALLPFEILTLLLIRETVSKHPVHGDDLSVSNGDGRPLHTSSRLQALISELKCGILLVGPSPCGLRQRGFQPAVSLSDPAAFALSGAAIIARAHAGPGSQMVTTGRRDLCRSSPFRFPPEYWLRHRFQSQVPVQTNSTGLGYGASFSRICLSSSSIISSINCICFRDCRMSRR